ncbi:DNA gyrase subunit A [Microcystis panniformis FACHB-1757]|uniref:DNA gyrase subunit A n=1 Tax=Microcystis panniformis FACHB-1757 TaxID=1638788 RepID=A0A0K1S697_9CHRO|nr:DNA gyrase subunit A [Microcystis panniformis FACHB-1757]
MGKWGNGEMGKWGNGEMGKWGNSAKTLTPQNPNTPKP